MRKLLVLIIAFFSLGTVLAQDSSKHEVSFFGTLGTSTIKYNTSFNDNKNGFGGNIGLGYNYHFTNRWSFKTGLELSMHNVETALDNYSSSYNSNDGQYDFEFTTTVSNYKETQNAKFLGIPLQLQFQMPAFKQNQFYAAAGVKIALPLSTNYTIVDARMKNSGVYPIWSGEEQLALNTQEFMGFGTFNRKEIGGEMDFNPAYMLALELGLKWNVRKKSYFYTAVCFDSGLNDIRKNDKNLIQYNTQDPKNFTNNSILETNIPDKVFPAAFGVKIGLTFGGLL